jgi:Short-chain alcohol dehydrogenase of unknown specificity
MVETALLDFGGLDILVNNAGIGHTPQPMEALGEDIFDRITEINMKAIYLAARHVVPRFKERKAGVILNMASTAASARGPTSPGTMLEGLGHHRDPFHGRGARPSRHPRQCPQPRRGRDAAAEDLHGRGHAGDPGQIPGDDSVGRFSTPAIWAMPPPSSAPTRPA